MNEEKLAEARRLVVQVTHELEAALEAARAAAVAPREDREAWARVQQLYTRFAAAEQLLRDIQRAVDAAYA